MFTNPDDRDWRAAKNADTADAYVGYLVAHQRGAHISEARETARKFLSVKYTELPARGQVLITEGWGKDLIFAASLDPSITRAPRVIQSIKEEGSYWFVDAYHDLSFKDGDAIFHPRMTCASILTYRDRSKGVLLSEFDIVLQGTSLRAPIFHISDTEAGLMQGEVMDTSECAALRYPPNH